MPVAEISTTGGGTSSSDAPAGGGAAEGADAASDVLSSIGFAAYGTGTAGGGAGFIGDLQSAASSGTGLASGQSGQALIAGAGGGGSGGIAGLAGGGGGVVATAGTVSSSDMQAAHQAAQVTFSASASGEAIDLGYRNMSDIRRKINIIKMRVQTAYESLLRSNPGASGTITIDFSITPGGAVTGVSISCPSSLSSLQGTVTSAVSSLNFGSAPEQTGNLPVTVPFSLIPPQ
jgi:TonB family protein